MFCIFFYISHLNWLGARTFSEGSQAMTDRIILDKVLSDERTAAYATTIDDINRRWLNCKDCDWYKSKQTIMSEARGKI